MDYDEKKRAKRLFSAIPDVGAYYPAQSAENARQKIFRSLDRGEGISILFGETGLGKTLLFRLLASEFEIDAPVLFLTNYRMKGIKSFLQQILFELRQNCVSNDEDELRLLLLDYLRDSKYPRFILFLDNGDSLPYSVFGELCALLDMEIGGEPRFRVAVSGSPRLEERLNHPRFAALSQRIANRCWLDPFTRAETLHYIESRMNGLCQDLNAPFFTQEGAYRVHKLAEGIPRVINQICDLALYLHSGGNLEIGEEGINKAWALLQQIPEENASENRAQGTAAYETSDLSPDEKTSASSSAVSWGTESESSVIEFGSLDDEEATSSTLEISPSPWQTASKNETENAEIVENAVTMDSDSDSQADSRTDFSDFQAGLASSAADVNLAEKTIDASEKNGAFADEIRETAGEEFRADNEEDEDELETDETDEDELVDETDADLTYDKMIQDRLLSGDSASDAEDESILDEDAVSEEPEVFPLFEKGSMNQKEDKDETEIEESDDTSFAGTIPFIPRSGGAPRGKMNYLEELKLLEMEVSQEAEVIKKIRGMQSGLKSFRVDMPEESVSESSASPHLSETAQMTQEAPSSQIRGEREDQREEERRETPVSSAVPAKRKASPFANIYRKLYPEKDS